MKIYTKLFWQDALERAAWTFAQFIVGLAGFFAPAVSLVQTGDLQAATIFVIAGLPYILLAAVGVAVFSVLKSMVAAYRAQTDTASFTVDTKPLNKE